MKLADILKRAKAKFKPKGIGIGKPVEYKLVVLTAKKEKSFPVSSIEKNTNGIANLEITGVLVAFISYTERDQYGCKYVWYAEQVNF